MMSPQGVATVIEGNEFKGFRAAYRALWVMNRGNVTIQDNVFTPEPNNSDFTAVLVGNREVWNGSPAPAAFGVTLLRNTFNANGAPAGNKAKAILFVNDNDPTGAAPGGSLQVGDGTAANANHFDVGIGWYVALDDRTCSNAQNHNGGGACNGTSAYAIGEGIAYSSGSNAKSYKLPFKWDVTAASNTFGGVPMASMTQAQYEAVLAKTFDNHNKVQTSATVGNVVYSPLPTNVSLTVTADEANNHRTGSFQVLDAVAANAGSAPSENVKMSLAITRVDGGAIVMDGNPMVDSAGDSLLVEFEDAGCTIASGNPHDGWCLYRLNLSSDGTNLSATFPQISPGFPAHTGDFHVYRQRAEFRVPGAYKITQTVFGETTNTVYATAESTLTVKQALGVAFTGANPTAYNASAQPLEFSVSPTSNLAVADLAAKVSLTYAGGTAAPANAGSYAVIAVSGDADYVIEPAATASYVINPLAGTLAWGNLNFPYDRSAHAVSASVVESGAPCQVTPATVGPEIGRYPVSAVCNDPNYVVAGGTATASVGGGNHVQVQETGTFYTSVAEALADSETRDGMTVRVAPGVSSTPIVLTKSVKLVGGVDIEPPFAPMAVNAGPIAAPVTILDGGNAAADGIVIANGVKDALISGFEVRNFTRHCIAANQGNDGLSVEQSHIHHCGGRGISVVGDVANVSIHHNAVHDVGDRGIVVWDGAKRDISIEANRVSGPVGATAIGLEDGSASGVLIQDNEIDHSAGGDTGIAILQLTSGSPSGRGNVIRNNTINDPGRFGIALMIPNGTGAESGDGSIVVEGNLITGGANQGGYPDHDRAGIQVVRRYFRGASQGQVDATQGVVIRGNTVSDFTRMNAGPGIEGYGIVVEGTGSSILGNTLSGNDVGLQIQQGNQPESLPGDSDLDVHSDFFDRGNTEVTCVSVGEDADANTISDSTLVDQRQVPPDAAMIGQGVTNETTHARYCSINAAIAAASAGDVIRVAAGTYAEDVVIDKAITLKGAKAGVNAGVGNARDASSGESIIVPATAEAGMSLDSTGKAVVEITSDGVSLDGFVIDADNPALSSGVALNGADPDVAAGIFARGSDIVLQNLVIRNATYVGIDGYNDSGASGGNLIRNNRFSNLTSPSAWGRGIIVEENFYAQISGNLMDQVRVGVQTNNYHLAAPNGFMPSISGNEIHATRTGIFHNLVWHDGTTWTFANNTIRASAHAAQTGAWSGVWVASMQETQTVVIESNTIDASALTGSGRSSAGYLLDNITSSAASSTMIDGGGVSNVDIGVHATDATAYTGPVNDFVVRNVDFVNVALAALYVEDSVEIAGSARLTIGDGNSYSNVAHRLALAGAAPTVGFTDSQDGSDEVFVRAAGNSIWGAAYTTTTAPIANGIAAAKVGGIVNLEAGTFPDNVVVDKPVTLQGPHAGVAGDDAARGTGEAILSPASGNALKILADDVVVDGLTVQNVHDHAILSGGNYGGAATANVSILNNRVLDVQAGSGLYTNGPYPAATNWTIQHNLVRNVVANTGSGLNYWAASGGVVADNRIEQTGFAGIQTVNSQGVQVLRNTISGTVQSGINVGTTNPAAIADAITVHGNRLSNTNTSGDPVDGGIKVSDGASNITLACNTVGGSGSNGITTGAGTATAGIQVWHNAITASSAISHNQGAGIDIGPNWYGGSAASVGGSNAAGAHVADALDADPTSDSACGDHAVVAPFAQTGATQDTPVDSAFAQPLGVRLVDRFGGSVAGQAIAFAVPASGASATLSAASGNTDYNGYLAVTASANGTAGGPYAVVASSGAISATFNLTNTTGTATITLDAATLNAVYSGAAHAVGASTTPAGLTYAVTYDGSAAAPVNAGSYAVVASVTDPNYSGTVSGTLTIAKASGTVGFDNLALTYTGAAQAVTAHIAEETTGACVVTPSSVGPAAGSYPVSASCSGVNHDASGSDTATIAQASATVLLSHLTQAHDGSPKSVVATTTPAGLPVSVTYAGSSTPPSAVGSYAVVATVSDANYSGSASGTLQIVAGASDIALVLNGPVDPVHVGTTAQYAATMLANPALHSGETFGYKVTLNKSNGSHALELADLASMEVFYQGAWVDALEAFGSIPFELQPDGSLVYLFPQGVPGYDNGFPIEDASWTWNFRFGFADVGTYTTTAELVDGVSHAPIDPAVTASIATVVEAALPPTDMHLVLGGPASEVTLGSPAEYNGTLLADPALHLGETFFVKVVVGKSGGAMTATDFTAMQIFLGGQWVDGADLGVVFSDDGHGNLVYLFPESQLPGGFPIEDAQWSWNFRFVYANAGVYTATAQVIPAYQAGLGNPDVLASAAIATTVVAAPVVTPDMKLLLIGPVDDVQAGTPAAYTGTLLANPDDFAGREFFVRVRLSKNGGADAMTVADLAKMELYLGGWLDATDDLRPQFAADGNDLVYLFPQPSGAFPIEDSIWTWHFRFTYASAGVYGAVADVVDAADADPLTAASLANAAVQTNVVPQASDIHLALQGPVVGTVGEALRYSGTLTADPLPDAGDLFFVHIKLSKNGGLSPMTAADLAKMEISLDGGASWMARDDLPLVENGNFLEYDFPQPDLADGFPITSASWGWDFRFTYADAANYRAEATVVTADAGRTAVSNTATVATEVAAQPSNITLQLNGPVAGIQVGQPAQYVGTLRADPLPDPSSLFFVEVRLHKSSGAMQVSDLSKMELLFNGNWQDATADLLSAFTPDGNDLVYLFPKPVLDDGFPIDEPEWSWQFRFTYADAAIYTATARVLDAAGLGQVSAPVTISTEVVPPSPNVSLQLNGPVADVQVDVPAAYIGRLTNHGPALTEDAYVKVRVELDGGTLAAGDVTAEVWFGGGWIEGTLSAVNGGLEVDFPDSSGFPIDAGMDFTHQFRITYHVPGLFSATATLVGANSGDVHANSGMYTDVVARSAVTASVLIDPASLHAVYDAAPHAATVTTTPAVQSVDVSYNGSAAAPTNAGTYVVIANVVDPVYVGSASAILVIDKAPSTITINPADLHQTTPVHAVGAVANPMTAGASVGMTYDGNAALPTAPGTYSVVATLLDPNYAGSASATLVVSDGAAVLISLDDAPAMALVGADAPYTDMLDYLGSIGNSGAPTAQAVHFELTAVRIDDGNATGGQPVAIAADDVLACVYDPSGWAAQEPDHHHGCPQDYNSLFLSQSAGSFNGRPATTFRYPNLAANDLPLPHLDPAMPLGAKFAFKHGQYQVHARIVGADGAVYATSALAGTTVPDVAIGYNGPTSGQAEDALASQSTLSNSGGRVDGNVIVRVTLADAASAALDPSAATFSYQFGGDFLPLPWTQAGNDLVTYYGPASGFPLEDGYDATSSAQGVFHREGSYALRYEVVDVATQQVYASSQSAITIGANQIVFDVSDLNAVYTGSPLPVTVAPATVPHTVVYEPMAGAACPATPAGNATVAPTDAGSYCVYVAATAPYAGSWSGTLVIAKASASVAIDGAVGNVVSRTFNGTAQVVTASTTPAALAYVVTYNGNSTAPSAAGSYALLATIDDANHTGIATGTLVISAQGGMAIVLDDDDGSVDGIIHRTFSGSAVAPVTATTTPAGVSYAVTYVGDGSTLYPLTATPPTAVGQYHVVATTTDANYGVVSASGTLVVDAAGASIALDAATLAATYDGQLHAVTATTTPAGLAYSVTYAGNANPPVNAGSYAVVATITAPGHSGTTSGTLVIAKAVGAVNFGLTNFTFDGQPHATTALISQEPGNATACTLTAASGDYPRTNAGSSTLNAVCTGSNYTASASTTLVVAPKPVTIALTGTGSFPYDGLPHAATAAVNGAVAGFPATATLTYNGGSTVPVAVGSYDVVASLDAASAQNYAATPVHGTIQIGSANATVTLAGLDQVYDGSPRTVTASTVPSGLATSITYDGNAAAPIHAGSYTVVATITAPGYSGSASGTLVVARAAATIALSDLTQVWDGQPKPVTATTTPAGLALDVRYDGSATAPSAIGTYAVLATITDANHSGNASGTLRITEAGASAIAANGATTFTGTAGQPLAGALPSVKVTDAGGHPVAGIAVTFVAAAGNGMLSGALQTTDGNGIATLGGWILDPTPGANTVNASAAGVTGTVAFTATGTAAGGALSVTITDGREFVKIGQALAYAITVGNAGSSNLASVPVSSTLPAEVDGAGATWQCIPVNGASCSGGNGHLVDTVALPARSSVVYLLNTSAVRGPSDRISTTVRATGPDGAVSATDVTEVVLFRDGFEGGDGAEAVGETLAAIGELGGSRTLALTVNAAALGSLRLTTLASAHDAAFRVEAIRIDGQVWLRLVARAGASEQATAWSALEGGTALLALEGGNLLLAGTASDLQLPLERSGSFAVDGPRY